MEKTTRIVCDPGGYTLTLNDQPWFDGNRTPKELISEWECADREHRVRFNAWLRQEREAEAKSASKWSTRFIVGGVLLCMLALVFL